MNDTTNNAPGRRRADDPAATSRRIGVLWSGDATTARYRVSSIVLDISPEGAKLKTEMLLLGHVAKFRLTIESLPPIECVPVWQQDGRVGVRFLTGQPSMAQLQNLIHPPEPHA